MQIGAVGCNYSADKKSTAQNNFKALVKDRTVFPLIKSMSQEDKLELKKFEKKLSKTKYWDLKISAIKNKFDELKFEFINKTNKDEVITDGIYPYAVSDNTIRMYSIVYGPQNTSGNIIKTLKFKSKARAEKLYNKYEENVNLMRHKNFNLTPIESLKVKTDELNLLEESTRYADRKSRAHFVNNNIDTKPFIGNDLSL